MDSFPLAAILVAFALWAIWLLTSARILSHIGFFSGEGLQKAAPRFNQFTLLHVTGVAFFYICLVLALVSILGPRHPAHLAVPIAVPAATARAPSTSPRTLTPSLRPPLLTESPAADNSKPDTDDLDVRALTRSQLIDMTVRILLDFAMAFLASRLVLGGLPAFGLAPRQLPIGLALGLLAAFLLVPWMLADQELTGLIAKYFHHAPPLHPILQALGQKSSPFAKAVLITSAVLIAPITEELFFRGYLQTTLINIFSRIQSPKVIPIIPPDQSSPINPAPQSPTQSSVLSPQHFVSPLARWVSILITSLLFALIHFDGTNPEVLPIIFLLALALGYLYEHTANLYACITLHACFNAVSTALFLLSQN